MTSTQTNKQTDKQQYEITNGDGLVTITMDIHTEGTITTRPTAFNFSPSFSRWR